MQKRIILFSVFIVIIISGTPLFSCAMVTHGEIAYRASSFIDSQKHQYYSQIIAANPGTLTAGAAFPDWGYSTGYGGESEEAHWDPFILEAVDYIHEKYGPPPWDSKVENLVVFVLGIMSHSMADLSWHNLGEDGLERDYGHYKDGFLEMLAQMNFSGNFSTAHDQEVGGDFILARSFGTEWYGDSWEIPSEDMAEVYSRRGYDISAVTIWWNAKVVLGAASEFLNLGGEKIDLTYSNYADKSPVLIEQFQDYFIGGLDEMAVSTYWRWLEIFNWLENGVPVAMKPVHTDIIPSGTPEDAGYSFFMEMLENPEIQKTGTKKANRTLSTVFSTERYTMFSSDIPYSYLGTGITGGDFNGDGRADLVTGAPGYSDPGIPHRGAVFINYGYNISGKKEIPVQDSELTIFGKEASSRFGWSAAAADLNADGYDDLCVGAPASGAYYRKYNGKIFVFPGSKNGLSEKAVMTISTSDVNGNIGYFLTSSDINGDGFSDLIISSPFFSDSGRQKGIAAFFLSSSNRFSRSEYDIFEADWHRTGDHDFDWFGYSVAHASTPSGSFIIAGAPGAKNGSLQSAGAVYGFLNSGKEPRFILSGNGEFDQTGMSVSIGSPYPDGKKVMAVSAVSRSEKETHGGTVYIVPFEQITGSGTIGINVKSVLNGSSEYGRFGWKTGFADYNNDGLDELFVSEPFLDGESGVESGAFYSWNGGYGFPAVTINDPPASADSAVYYGTAKSRFGYNMSFLDFNGDGCSDFAVSARQNSQNARFSGRVHLYISDVCPYVEDPEPVEENDDDESGEGDHAADTDSSVQTDDTDSGISDGENNTPDSIDKETADENDTEQEKRNSGCSITNI